MKSSFDSIQSINVKLTFIPVVFVLLRMWGTFRFFFVIAEQHCLARNPFFLALHVSHRTKKSVSLLFSENCVIGCWGFLTRICQLYYFLCVY
jgi:hypothetical protein